MNKKQTTKNVRKRRFILLKMIDNKRERDNKRATTLTDKGRRRTLSNRLLWACVLFIAAVVYLFGRVAYIKVKMGDEYEKKVYERMAASEKPIAASRGGIVDRNNKPLVTSHLVYHMILEPYILLNECTEEDRQHTYQVLAEYTGETPAFYEQMVQDNPSSWYKIIQRNISAEDMLYLKGQKVDGLWFEEDFRREYPKGTLAAQTLGFYNGENGQYGIEQAYNTYLTGVDGRMFPQAYHGDIIINEIKPSVPGYTIVSTIDEVIQQYVERVMTEYVATYEPLNASAMVMNPKTGEIYAMYSYPTFDPNQYTTLEEVIGTEAWRAMSQEERSALLNRAWQNFNIQFAYEPGSTLKPVIAAIALEEGYIGLEDTYMCTGHNNVSGTHISCWKTSGHGIQTVEQALANSCNSAMIQIAEKVPTQVFFEYLVKFGLGEKTRIQLPGEASGLLHTLDRFGPVEKATASMGQGITVTPIQLMSSLSAIINGGYLMEPYVVSEVVDHTGSSVFTEDTTVRRQVISAETADIITKYLRTTITEGTGANSNIGGYTIAGKTGTAEKLPRGSDKYVISFVGYAPVDDPEVITLVLFDEAPEKSGAPTKAFNDMMQNILPYLNIKATEEASPQVASTTTVPSIGELALTDGLSTLQTQNLGYEIVGVGSTITEQYPQAGTKLPVGSVVKVYVATDTPQNIIEVPELVGQTVQRATQITKGFFELVHPEAGEITYQMPRAGTKVEKGTKIIVQTSQEQE